MASETLLEIWGLARELRRDKPVILGIDHVGVAVREAGAAAATFERLLGRAPGAVEDVPGQQVRVCFVPGAEPSSLRPGDVAGGGAGPARLELLEPVGEETAVGRFLERRGEGMHHICLAVDDIIGEMARLARDGFDLIDEAPRPGHGGLVAFLHPRKAHGVLVELLQRDPLAAHPSVPSIPAAQRSRPGARDAGTGDG